MSFKYKPATQSMLCLIFLMYLTVGTIKRLNYVGQDLKKQNNLQFMILTHL